MPTLREFCYQRLFNSLIMSDLCNQILNEAEASNKDWCAAVRGQWNKSVIGLPAAAVELTWLNLKIFAAEYLEKQHPKHFAINVLREEEVTFGPKAQQKATTPSPGGGPPG